jgi:hypothetical protein
MHAAIQTKEFYFPIYYLKMQKHNMWTHNFACCFTWAQILVSCIKKRTYIQNIWEQGTGQHI